jgi:hypothetical protein
MSPSRFPSRRILALATLVASVLLSTSLAGPAAAAPSPSYSLAVSTQPDRSSPQPLSGKTYDQSTNLYIYATPATSVKRVRFYLDTSTSATPAMIETTPPYDFAGTASDGSAVALATSTLSPGSHTVTAVVETTTNKVRTVSATFTVMWVAAPPPRVDTTRPPPASLSATPGDQQIALSWSAATDNVGVARYEVWQDNGYVTGLGSAARSYTATGLAAGVSHSYRVVAYDAAGNYANSNTVTAAATTTTTTTTTTPPPPPPPDPTSSPDPSSTATPAPFPSRLRAVGRSIVDENGYVLPLMRGFNMHVGPGFTWDQSHFDAIAAAGGKINRAVIHWDQFEPSKGVVDPTAIANLDLHIARARAAGIYTLLELHLNVGRTPSWTQDKPTEVERYAAYGQTLTQYLANRYGNPASPQYTKAVVGFGLNEPPLEDNAIRNGNGSIPYLESKQRQMISWMRALAPSWIGFVAYGYAQATPIYDHTWQNPNAIDADPAAYDGVGGNVVIDLHDYSEGCNNTDPNCDGRQYNGMIWPTYQGGPLVSVGTAYTSSSLRLSQQAAYIKPYATFSARAGIPLMIGEWGWSSGSGESAWMADKQISWANAGTVIQIQWNYDVSSTNTVWAARPGGVWRPSVSRWLFGA